MTTKTLTQAVTIEASPADVYRVFMDSKLHGKITGAKAQVGERVGDEWWAYDGSLKGTQVELQPGKKIVQTWQSNEDGWPEDHFSRLSLTFKKVKHGTEVHLKHSGIPSDVFENIQKGWHEYYWEPMNEHFSK